MDRLCELAPGWPLAAAYGVPLRVRGAAEDGVHPADLVHGQADHRPALTDGDRVVTPPRAQRCAQLVRCQPVASSWLSQDQRRTSVVFELGAQPAHVDANVLGLRL